MSKRPLIPDASHRCMLMTLEDRGSVVASAVDALSQDRIILIRNVSNKEADSIVYQIAGELGLQEKLELQASFSGFHGHRQQISKYFMTVNSRQDYQFITPHSEGDRLSNMQLACFFCFENSTDGGETILLNVDDASEAWALLRELVIKMLPGSKPLSRGEAARAKALYRLRSPNDYLISDDKIVREAKSAIPGLLLASVLTKVQKTYSPILKRDVNVVWDNIGSVDQSCLQAFVRMLQDSELLKIPPSGFELRTLDSYFYRRIWSSGADYENLFQGKIVLKLKAGDLVIQNNLTWVHGVNNWTSGSGTRRVGAAFA
jgi:hypothetical protein